MRRSALPRARRGRRRVVKHNNPCGVAIDTDVAAALPARPRGRRHQRVRRHRSRPPRVDEVLPTHESSPFSSAWSHPGTRLPRATPAARRLSLVAASEGTGNRPPTNVAWSIQHDRRWSAGPDRRPRDGRRLAVAKLATRRAPTGPSAMTSRSPGGWPSTSRRTRSGVSSAVASTVALGGQMSRVDSVPVCESKAGDKLRARWSRPTPSSRSPGWGRSARGAGAVAVVKKGARCSDGRGDFRCRRTSTWAMGHRYAGTSGHYRPCGFRP